jgi:hypothetical protein
MRRRALLAALLGIVTADALAAPQTVTGPESKVNLLELYTSEGCDSCPPAEQWISGLQQDRRLWRQLVPVTFHVDYWDYLGWRDPFDRHSYTERQQLIAAQAGSLAERVIYTPQFVLDGQDWHNWFNHKPLQVDDTAKLGPLSLTADGRKITVHFSPTLTRSGRLEAQVVLLAFGVDVPVGAGENQGKTLRHDFLVIADGRAGLTQGKDGSYAGTLTLSAPLAFKASRYALAGWVSAADSPLPIQAAGGWWQGSLPQ